MLCNFLKSKIAYACLTQTDLHYEGSISIDEDIMDQAGLREFEQVQVLNLNNGERLETYVIKGPRGSQVFGLNGPAARKGLAGDFVHILSYALCEHQQPPIQPKVVNLKK